MNYLLFKRPGKWIAGITQKIEKALGKDDMHARIDQIDQAISMETDDATSEEEKNILKGIAQFGNVTVRKAMRSRLDVNGIEEIASFGAGKRKVEEQQYSRFPVVKESLDTITGVLHAKDLIPHLDEKDASSIQEILHPIIAVPESMSATDLINKFTKERKSIAWVVDEFGGTAGIVTMEDVLEEIFGEIRDEYDVEEFVEKQLAEDEFIFSGRLELDYLKEKYELDFPENESETLSGYIINKHEAIPKQKATIIVDHYQIDVLTVSDTRIEMVKLKILR